MISTNAFDYINVLDKAADASWMRENAITNNIANGDTPGYKRQDVAFEGILQSAIGNMSSGSLDKKVRELNQDLSNLSTSVYTDSASYSYRLDHNNVDPDSEHSELASEQLKYQLLTNAINMDFSRLTAVLK